MKLCYDFLPLLLFFATYKLYGIFVATGVAIATIVLQVGFLYLRGKKPEIMQWITLAMVSLLGGATLFFRNELFIKWKPTAVYWLLGLVFAISQAVSKKNLVQKMLEKSLSLPAKGWALLNTSWYTFFFIMGALNLAVASWFDTDTWVNFKLFGTLGFTLFFALIQGALISRFLSPTLKEEENTHS